MSIKAILSGKGRGREKSDQDTNESWRFKLLNEKALEQDQAEADEDSSLDRELKVLQSDPANKIFIVEANNPTGQSTGNIGATAHFTRIVGQQTGTASSSATSKLASRRRTNSSRTSFSN